MEIFHEKILSSSVSHPCKVEVFHGKNWEIFLFSALPSPVRGLRRPHGGQFSGFLSFFFVKKLTLQFEGRYGMVFVRKCPPGVGVSEKSVIFLHLFPFYREKTRFEPCQISLFSVTKLVNFRKKTPFPLYIK